MQLEPLTPAIGATIRGVDLSERLPDEAIAEIRSALDQRLVLFFEEQVLDPIQQRNFAARFGPLYTHPFYPGHAQAPEIMVLLNDATHPPNADRWHNDVTYLEAPPQASVLYAEEIPEIGGDTLWANMYAAYDALSQPMKNLVSGLRAVHSFAKNFTRRTLPRPRDGRSARSNLRGTSAGLTSGCPGKPRYWPQSAVCQSRLYVPRGGLFDS